MLYMPIQGPFTLKRTIIEGDKRADIEAEFRHAEEGRLTTELEEVRSDMPIMSLRIEYARRNKLRLWTDEGDPLESGEFECGDLTLLEELAARWRGHDLNAGTSKQQALIRVTEQNRKAKLSHDERVELLKLNGAYEQEIPERYDYVFSGWSVEEGGVVARFGNGWTPHIEKFEAELRKKRWPPLPGKDGVVMRMRIRSEITKLFEERHPTQRAARDVATALAQQAKIERVNQLYRYGHGRLLEVPPAVVCDEVIELMKKGEPTFTLEDANRQRWWDLGLRFSFSFIDRRTDRVATDWDKTARHFRCTIEREGQEFVFEYSQGSGIKEMPDVLRVLESLQLDSRVGPEWDRGFEDWCENYGYDPDSRKAEGIYEACLNTRASMRRVLGEEMFELWMQED